MKKTENRSEIHYESREKKTISSKNFIEKKIIKY